MTIFTFTLIVIALINTLILGYYLGQYTEKKERIRSLEEMIERFNRTEEERSAARCPKCGDRVLGDEDGLCGNCV